MFKKALVIGINDYPLSPLKACKNDARQIGDLLSLNEDGTNNFDVTIETDIRTRSELRVKISKLFQGEADVALLYFSGHGFANELGGQLVTPDARKNDEGIFMEEIIKLAIHSRIKSKIIILDCCYSGHMGGNITAGENIATISDGTIILTACSKRETAKEIGEHGLFTSLLIDALKGGAADILGHITPGSIYGYIDKALGAWDQRPVFKASVSRFVSLRNTLPHIELPVLRKITSYFTTHEMIFPLNRTFEFTNPEAIQEHIVIFKHLQQMESVGLVKPSGEEHLYFAAQNGKGCFLTPVGQSYWKLVKQGRV